MQGPPAHTLTSVHTSVPQKLKFVHTDRVDTCIEYMYRLVTTAAHACQRLRLSDVRLVWLFSSTLVTALTAVDNGMVDGGLAGSLEG